VDWRGELPSWEVFEASESFDFWHVWTDATTQKEYDSINEKIKNPWRVPLPEYYLSAQTAIYEWLSESPEHAERGFKAVRKKQRVTSG
jgi:hypothetical protein